MTWKRASLVLVGLLQGCGIYTFSGTSLPPAAKTFSLQVQSSIAQGPFDLPEQLQQRLEETLMRRTRLKQVDIQGDLRFVVTIKRFEYQSQIPSIADNGEEQQLDRLTIAVEVSYINPYDKELSLDKKFFSGHADMLTDADRIEEEPRLVDKILPQIIQDILSTTVVSW